jgi:hypothetical protein
MFDDRSNFCLQTRISRVLHLHCHCHTARKYHPVPSCANPQQPCENSARVSTSGGVESGPMAIPGALTRKRGNPDWGHPPRPVPALPTEFEVRVSQLQLSPERYTSSAELRAWCERNRNRCYVPEWLLKEWDITVDPSSAA